MSTSDNINGEPIVIQSLKNGQVIKYISGTGLWTNAIVSGTFNEPAPGEFVTTASVSIAGGLGFGYTADSVGTDAYFFVSGNIDGKNSAIAGVSVFGGDVVVSGTLYAEKQVIEVDEFTTGSLLVSGNLIVSQSADIKQGLNVNTSREGYGITVYGDGSTSTAFFLSGSGGTTSPDESQYTDVAFFVSGSQGSKGGTVRGTALFGGDVVISGTLHGGSPLKIGTDIQISGSIFSTQGLSGSLTRLEDGSSYLIAGSNVTIVSGANGSVTISSTGGGGGGGNLLWQSDVADIAYTTGSIEVTGSATIKGGISGSLTRLDDGSSYLIAGSNVTIVSGANGSVTISSTGGGGGGGGNLLWQSTTSDVSFNTGSIEVTGSAFIKQGLIVTSGSTLTTPPLTLPLDNPGGAVLAIPYKGAIVSYNSASNGWVPIAKYDASATDAVENVLTIGGRDLGGGIGPAGVVSLVAENGTPNQSISAHADSGSLNLGVAGASFIGAYSPGKVWPSEFGTDVFFYVSGSSGSKGTTDRGAAVFGGDVVISGTLFGGSPLKIGSDLQLTGALLTAQGLSGSLTRLEDGSSYLIAGDNITIVSGANGSVTISSTGGGGGGVATDYYDGYISASLTWTSTTWADVTSIATTFQDRISSGIIRSGSTFTVSETGKYYWTSNFANFDSGGYIGFRLSGSNGTIIQRTSFAGNAESPGLLQGVLELSASDSFVFEYAVDSAFIAYNNTTLDGETGVSGRVSMFLLGDGGGGGGGSGNLLWQSTTSDVSFNTGSIEVTGSALLKNILSLGSGSLIAPSISDNPGGNSVLQFPFNGRTVHRNENDNGWVGGINVKSSLLGDGSEDWMIIGDGGDIKYPEAILAQSRDGTSSDNSWLALHPGSGSFLMNRYGLRLTDTTADFNRNNGTDVFFFASGAINSKDTSTRGTAVFGGDVHISGNLTVDGTFPSLVQMAGNMRRSEIDDLLLSTEVKLGGFTLEPYVYGSGTFYLSVTGYLTGTAATPPNFNLRLYDMGAPGTPQAPDLRVTASFTTTGSVTEARTLMTVVPTLTPLTGEILGTRRVYEVRGFLTGAVGTLMEIDWAGVLGG